MNKLQEDWERLRKTRLGAEIWELAQRYCEDLIGVGFRHYSSDALMHRIRWHHSLEYGPEGEFKINNNHTPYLARELMAQGVVPTGFFRTRNCPNDE